MHCHDTVCLHRWLGLELLHTVFAREHNQIAAMLAAAYPAWSDQQLFDKARMITAGVLAKLHTIEWTPAILPNVHLARGMNVNWSGLISMLPPLSAAAMAALKPPPNDGVYGFRGGVRLDAGVPYSMTEVGRRVHREALPSATVRTPLMQP